MSLPALPADDDDHVAGVPGPLDGGREGIDLVGLIAVGHVGQVDDSDVQARRVWPYSMTQSMAAITWETSTAPVLSATLTDRIRAPGATPWKPSGAVVAGDDRGHHRAVPVGVASGEFGYPGLERQVRSDQQLVVAVETVHRFDAGVDHRDVDARSVEPSLDEAVRADAVGDLDDGDRRCCVGRVGCERRCGTEATETVRTTAAVRILRSMSGSEFWFMRWFAGPSIW